MYSWHAAGTVLAPLPSLLLPAAAYYTSFPAVGICIYFLRTRFGYQSLPEAIAQRYGPTATVAFGCAVLYR
jgi:hypothetical protein